MTATADTTNLQDLATTCAEGDCAHGHRARDLEQRIQSVEYSVQHALDYLDDRDGISPEVASTLRGILKGALNR